MYGGSVTQSLGVSEVAIKATLINSLCGRIAVAETPRGTRNLDIFLYS